MAHADLVASVLKLRLQMGGVAFLSMAVRDQACLSGLSLILIRTWCRAGIICFEESHGTCCYNLHLMQILQAILDKFVFSMGTLGMSVHREEIKPSVENKGILGLERDYEGGFAMLTIKWLAI